MKLVDTRIKIENLWHHYGASFIDDGWSLKSIDFNLGQGELVGLLGPSGCGKTTLLRLIAGFEIPNKGIISINDQVVASPSYSLPPERRGVGMVFQDYALFPHLDAWSNACFGLRRGQDPSRAEWLFDLLGLSEYKCRFPHELSGGQKQRLALARALAPGTSLVVLDEPFSNLDVEVRHRLRSQLSGVLKSCSASAIFVTHDPQEALAICDRVAVMQDGELHQCSTPTELVNQPATPFVGRFVLQRNVLPVQFKGDHLLTPIGTIAKPDQLSKGSSTELMLDEQGLQIEPHPNGSGLVQGREFFGSHWIFRVEICNQILRVWHPISTTLTSGDRCKVNFRYGHCGLLFPNAIPCPLV